MSIPISTGLLRFTTASIGIIAIALVATACAVVAPSIPAPEPPNLSVAPGTTRINASWPPVAGADSYQVRWRHQGENFSDSAAMIVTSPAASFDVGAQGLWVVRVTACQAGSCGPAGASTTPVIINISGHQSVRVWFDFDPDSPTPVATVLNIDWDPLPGYYLVEYGLSSDNQWLSSPPLSEVGYTLNAVSFTGFSGDGHPVIRVFFNCNQDGERCTLLGNFPNDSIERVNSLPAPHRPSSTTSAGAAGSVDPIPPASPDLRTRLEYDPITNLPRPSSDFTVTNEISEDGVRYRCISRPAENPRELGEFGDAADAIKRCSGSKTEDQYEIEPDAVFPNNNPCGYRAPENDTERADYGDQVKVCNRYVPFDEIVIPLDQPTIPPKSRANGPSHSHSHTVDHYAYRTWPASYALSYGPNDECTRETWDQPNIYQSRYHFHTSITVDWCYKWRTYITKAQTLRVTTDMPNLTSGPGILFLWQFCGWKDGLSPDNPYEIIWQYRHPESDRFVDTRRLLDWGFSSQVEA